jgi:hypothetical protein
MTVFERQTIHPDHPLVWLYCLAIVPAIAIVGFVAWQPWIEPALLWEDPLVVARERSDCCMFYYGALSNVGVLLWAITAAICSFSAIVVGRMGRPGEQVKVLLLAGILSALLAFDDMFLIHEDAIPQLLGLDKRYAYGIYSILTAIYLTRFRNLLLAADAPLLVLSVLVLAGSLCIDIDLMGMGALGRSADIGAKFIGITMWCAFHIRLAWLLIDDTLHNQLSSPA